MATDCGGEVSSMRSPKTEPDGPHFLVWGAGGHGRMVGDLVRALGYQLAGYVDRNADRLGTIVEPLGAAISYLEDDLLESLQNSRRYPEGIDAFALGIGDNRSREACLRSLEEFEVPA